MKKIAADKNYKIAQKYHTTPLGGQRVEGLLPRTEDYVPSGQRSKVGISYELGLVHHQEIMETLKDISAQISELVSEVSLSNAAPGGDDDAGL